VTVGKTGDCLCLMRNMVRTADPAEKGRATKEGEREARQPSKQNAGDESGWRGRFKKAAGEGLKVGSNYIHWESTGGPGVVVAVRGSTLLGEKSAREAGKKKRRCGRRQSFLGMWQSRKVTVSEREKKRVIEIVGRGSFLVEFLTRRKTRLDHLEVLPWEKMGSMHERWAVGGEGGRRDLGYRKRGRCS